MNGYIAFFNGRKCEIRANSLYDAKQEAVRLLRVPKTQMGLLAVVLAEKNVEAVTHDPGSL